MMSLEREFWEMVLFLKHDPWLDKHKGDSIAELRKAASQPYGHNPVSMRGVMRYVLANYPKFVRPTFLTSINSTIWRNFENAADLHDTLTTGQLGASSLALGIYPEVARSEADMALPKLGYDESTFDELTPHEWGQIGDDLEKKLNKLEEELGKLTLESLQAQATI